MAFLFKKTEISVTFRLENEIFCLFNRLNSLKKVLNFFFLKYILIVNPIY